MPRRSILAAILIAAPLHAQVIQLPATPPASYPRSGSLSQVNTWLDHEFGRIAEARDDGPLPTPPRPSSFCRVILSFPTAEALPIAEWRHLAVRATADLRSTKPDNRIAALNLVSLLLEFNKEPFLRGLISVELANAATECLKDAEAPVRALAVSLILGIGEAASLDLVPAVIPVLKDPDPTVRTRAVMAVRNVGVQGALPGVNRFGLHAASIADAMLALADDPSRMTRLSAIQTIGYTGPAAAPHIPQLIQWLSSPDDMQRRAAIHALAELGPVAAEAGVPALAAILPRNDDRDRFSTLTALRRLGAYAAPAVPAIAALLQDPDIAMIDAATWTLANIGPGAAGALPQLRDLAARSVEPHRTEITHTIEIIEGRRVIDDSPPRLPNPPNR